MTKSEVVVISIIKYGITTEQLSGLLEELLSARRGFYNMRLVLYWYI